MSKILLKSGKTNFISNKDPLIFSGTIKQSVGEPRVADLVEVYDANKKLIGTGFYNPHSQYRVRLLTFAHEKFEQQLPNIIKQRIADAIAKRVTQQLPNEQTTVYRLVNSEADMLSGLTIDRFDEKLVVSVTAYWVMLYRETILHILHELGFEHIIWRPQKKALTQDGWFDVVNDVNLPQISTVLENNLQYQVDLGTGQKTGFYCDQRDNRLLIRELAKGKTVLDICCYSGGFALNAALGGAKEVVGIDSSSAAIELAKHNATLNDLCTVDFTVAKADEYLKNCKPFDVIILDPPKLVPRKQHLNRAKQHYIKLNSLALMALNKGGHLLTFSCSNAISLETFVSIVKLAAKKAGKNIKILSTHSAGQDHPYLPNAVYGNYLKGCLLYII